MIPLQCWVALVLDGLTDICLQTRGCRFGIAEFLVHFFSFDHSNTVGHLGRDGVGGSTSISNTYYWPEAIEPLGFKRLR